MAVHDTTASFSKVLRSCLKRILNLNTHNAASVSWVLHADLLHAGLSLLNLSLDTLKPDRFERMTRRRGHDRVLETLQLALSLGFDPVKVCLWYIECTCLRANTDS